MCNEDNLQLLGIDFSTVNDEINWFNNGLNPVTTTGGMLVLKGDTSLSYFSRSLGIIDPNKNRVKLKLNLEISRPAVNGVGSCNYIVEIWRGLVFVGQCTINLSGISAGNKVDYYLERAFTYSQLSGAISIKIKTQIGFDNEIRLKNIDVSNYFLCEDNIRTYFVLDQFFEDSLQSVSAGLRLQKWLVGGVETLTPLFHNNNQLNVGGDPLATWLYAHANIDGSNRVQDDDTPNTFNPFLNEWGIDFDHLDSYFGGSAIGTVNGDDYGTGVLKLGVDKPEILNGLLQTKKGAFYIDIDYTKDLEIQFDVIINNLNTDVYSNPSLFKTYHIKWNATTCKKEFYHITKLVIYDQINNGFLTGITPPVYQATTIDCGTPFAYTGNDGVFTFEVDFGEGTGTVGIDYNVPDKPVKIDVFFDGNFYTTHFKGNSDYNQQLINIGYPLEMILTNNPSNGVGQLLFPKPNPTPTKAFVTVTVALSESQFTITGLCPDDAGNYQNVIVWKDTQTNENRTGMATEETIDVPLLGIGINTWEKNVGAGFVELPNAVLPTDNVFPITIGLNEWRAKSVDNLGATLYSNVSRYLNTTETFTLSAYRSNAILTGVECEASIPNGCYINSVNANAFPIVNGDRVLNIDLTPYNGFGLIYRIKSALVDIDDTSFICTVDNDGFITVNSECSP